MVHSDLTAKDGWVSPVARLSKFAAPSLRTLAE